MSEEIEAVRDMVKRFMRTEGHCQVDAIRTRATP